MSAASDLLVRHASAVVFEPDAPGGGFGVMIEGPSGSGKSALALQLMAHGAQLVADDRCRIEPRDAGPWLLAPERLAGVIEARGLGLLSVPFCAAAPLCLIVDMGQVEMARLPHPRYQEIAANDIRCIRRVDGPHLAGSIVALSKGSWYDP